MSLKLCAPLKLLVAVVIGLLTLAPELPARSVARRTEDSMKLRQIGNAVLIYSSAHQDRLPNATDVWDFAYQLAEIEAANDGALWQSRYDPASGPDAPKPMEIILAKTRKYPRQPNRAFREIKPSFAVALEKLSMNHSSTTPIAWTRGLQTDGTWAAHSPYGTEGGFIYFLGGNVAFYRNLTDDGGQLIARDGAKTSNIMDALPRNVRIGEYTPTEEEKQKWASTPRDYSSHSYRTSAKDGYLHLLVILFVSLPFICLSIIRAIKKQPGVFSVLIWPVVLGILVLILFSKH